MGHAHVIRGHEVARASPLFGDGPGETHGRRIVREEIRGRLRAEALVTEARAKADAMLAAARTEAERTGPIAEATARERAQAEVAAEWLAVRHNEHKRIETGTDQVIAIAVALSERLLGTLLELDPSRVADLARAAIKEARGARRAVIDAHPEDAMALRQHMTLAGLDVQTVEVRDDAALARGELRLHTDVGAIDARLAPRFERLAAALRDALK